MNHCALSYVAARCRTSLRAVVRHCALSYVTARCVVCRCALSYVTARCCMSLSAVVCHCGHVVCLYAACCRMSVCGVFLVFSLFKLFVLMYQMILKHVCMHWLVVTYIFSSIVHMAYVEMSIL